MRWCLLLLLLASLACGGSNRTAGPSDTAAGPNYSKAPCADNCGGDATCVSHCTDLSGPTGPPIPPLR